MSIGGPRVLLARANSAPLATGLTLALATALISGVSVFLNGFAAKEFGNPTLFTALKNSLVGLCLLAFMLRPIHVREVKALGGRSKLGLLAIAVVGGSIPFVLFFEGLSRVDSGNAAFIYKTLFIWVAVLALVFLRERIGALQVGALLLLVLAQFLLGGPGSLGLGTGETMVLIATLLWAVEAVLARRLLQRVSSSVGATARMAGGAVIILTYLTLKGDGDAWLHLSAAQAGWLALTALFLLAYVSTWYAALKRVPATSVTAVLTLGAPVTAALSALDGVPAPDPNQLLAYVLLLAGAAVIALTLVARPAVTGTMRPAEA